MKRALVLAMACFSFVSSAHAILGFGRSETVVLSDLSVQKGSETVQAVLIAKKVERSAKYVMLVEPKVRLATGETLEIGSGRGDVLGMVCKKIAPNLPHVGWSGHANKQSAPSIVMDEPGVLSIQADDDGRWLMWNIMCSDSPQA